MSDTNRRPRRPSGSRAALQSGSIEGCLEGGKSTVETLKDEIESWKDNLSSNGMEHLDKYQEVEDCYDALSTAFDSLDAIEVPDFLSDITVKYTIDTRRKARSRAGQLGNAERELEASVDGARQWLEDHPALEEGGSDDEEGADVVTEADVEIRQGQIDECQEFIDAMESAISELGEVGFPGMY